MLCRAASECVDRCRHGSHATPAPSWNLCPAGRAGAQCRAQRADAGACSACPATTSASPASGDWPNMYCIPLQRQQTQLPCKLALQSSPSASCQCPDPALISTQLSAQSGFQAKHCSIADISICRACLASRMCLSHSHSLGRQDLSQGRPPCRSRCRPCLVSASAACIVWAQVTVRSEACSVCDQLACMACMA